MKSHSQKIEEVVNIMEKRRGYRCKKNFPFYLENSFRRIDIACFKENKFTQQPKAYAFEVEKNSQQFVNAKKLLLFKKLFGAKICQLNAEVGDKICREIFLP